MAESNIREMDKRSEDDSKDGADPIRDNYVLLSKCIRGAIDPIIAYLYQERIISDDAKYQISELKESTEKAYKVLDIVKALGPDGCQVFYTAIKQECLWAAADLLHPENSPHLPVTSLEDSGTGNRPGAFSHGASGQSGTDYQNKRKESLPEKGREFDVQQLESMPISESIPSTASPRKDLDIIILGLTGHGKSSTGNSILGKEYFPVSQDPHLKPLRCILGQSYVDGRILTVFDTPGLDDSRFKHGGSFEKAHLSFEHVAALCPDGFDAMLIVVRNDAQLTYDDLIMLMAKRHFPINCGRTRSIVVCTEHSQTEPSVTGNETHSEIWKCLLNSCYNKCVHFNNLIKDKAHLQCQRQNLYDSVNKGTRQGHQFALSDTEIRKGEEIRSRTQVFGLMPMENARPRYDARMFREATLLSEKRNSIKIFDDEACSGFRTTPDVPYQANSSRTSKPRDYKNRLISFNTRLGKGLGNKADEKDILLKLKHICKTLTIKVNEPDKPDPAFIDDMRQRIDQVAQISTGAPGKEILSPQLMAFDAMLNAYAERQ